MNGAYPVSWIFMLLMVLAVFGALAAIIWRSWIAGSVVLLFILAFFGLYWVRAVPSTPPSIVMMEEVATPAIERTDADIDFLKTANIYSSKEEAARFIALRICDDIQRSQPAISAANIHIVSAKKDRIAQIVTDVFTDQYPSAKVVADDIHDGDSSQLLVTLTAANPDTCINLKAVQNGRTFRQEVCFKNAPWVNNVDQYKQENPNGEWIVGSSSMAELTIESAKQRARQDAANKILPFLIAKAPELTPADPNWLRSRLQQELVHHKFIKDDYLQTMHTPVVGTTVYRAALLVDASSSQVEKLHSSLMSEYRHRNDRIHRFGGGVVGMGLVICLVYLFLNRATRGYFEMNLRLAAFLMLIAGVLMMMLIG